MVRKWKFRRGTLILMGVIALGMAAILLAMGRPPTCTCGFVKLWEGTVNSAGNSQHFSDWYSFSHITHGFLFYAGTWWLLRQWMRIDTRLAIAVLLEAIWEIAENASFIIDRYRTMTIALGYAGDSVLNSLSDVVMMAAGFLFAAKVSVRVTLVVGFAFELLTLWAIRDNLTLNVLMLLHPVDAIRNWQAAY